jgi:hypothetical protein
LRRRRGVAVAVWRIGSRLARIASIFLLCALAAGCLDAPARRAGPRPATTRDGTRVLRIERYHAPRAANEDETAPIRYEGAVRCVRASGAKKGETLWVAPLDDALAAALAPAEGEDEIALRLEGEPGREVVVASAPRAGDHAPPREQRFLLASGEPVE